MIVEFYENPNKPAKFVYVPPTGVLPGPKSNDFYVFQAERKGITVMEFKRRDAIVRKAYKEVTYFVGQLMYPYTKEEFAKHGPCRIQGMYKEYADYPCDKDHWDPKDTPFIVTAHPQKEPNKTFFATPKFFILEEPTA